MPGRKRKGAPAGGEGMLTNAGSAGLALASGVTTGIDTLGSFIELAAPDIGDAIRTTGLSGTQWLQSKMSPSWQEAVNKNWATLDQQSAAYRDPKAWAAMILQQLPYMVGTLGAGAAAGAGLKAAGGLVAKQTAKSAAKAEAGGHVVAQAAAGAGEAASGAAQAADAAGKTPEERMTAMRTAAPVGAVSGAVLGKVLGPVLGENTGGVVRRALTTSAGEIVQEGGTAVGTELGKTTAGLPFEWGNVGEAAVAGGAGGLGTGAALGKYAVNRDKKAAAAKALHEQGIAQADAAEKQALADEAELQRTKLANDQVGVGTLPPGVVAPSTAPPQRPQIPNELTREGQLRPTLSNEGIPAVTDSSTATVRPPTQSLTPEGPYKDQIDALEEKLSKLTPPGQIKVGPQKQGSKGNVKFKLTSTEQTQRAKAASIYKSTRDQINFLRKRNLEAIAVSGNTVGQAHTIEQPTQPLLPMVMLEKADPAVRDQAEQEAFDALFDEAGEIKAKRSAADPVAGPLTPTPVETAINASVKRSQAARAGVETKRAKKAAESGAVTTQPQAASSSGSAEASAVLARTGPKKPARVPAQKTAITPPLQPPAVPQEMAAPPVPEAPVVAPAAPVRKRGVVQAPSVLPVVPATQTQVQGPPPQAPPLAAADPALNTEVKEATPEVKQTAADFMAYRAEAERKLRQTPPPPAAANAVEISRGRSKPARGRAAAGPTLVQTPAPAPAPAPPPVEEAAPALPPPPKTVGQMTPRERLAHVLKDGPQTLDTVLAAMQDAYSGQGKPNTFTLIERLRRALPGTKNAPIKLMVMNTPLSEGFQGMYDPKHDVILIDLAQAENAPQVFLHEAVHAATIITMRTNKVVRDRITALMEEARETWKELGWQPDVEQVQAFASAEEFIATALTDTEFHDTLQNLPDKDSDASVFRKLATMLGRLFGMQQNPKTYELFHTLLEFVPDGAFLQAPERQAVLAGMDQLGLTDPVASLLSIYRSTLRGRAAATPGTMPPVERRGWIRTVWRKTLWAYTPEQMARSYGHLGQSYTDLNGNVKALPHDVINQHYALISGREAYAERHRIVSGKIAGYAEGAIDPVTGSQAFDDILVNARMWGLDPAAPLGATDPANAWGISQPGGPALFAEITKQWNVLNPVQKNAFKMFRDSYRAAWEDEVNRLTVNIVRTELGEVEAAKVDAYIKDPKRTQARLHVPDIPISWQQSLEPADVASLLHTIYGPPTLKTVELMKRLNAIQDVLGKAKGPYIPLRREGNFFAITRSPEVTATMSEAALARMIEKDRLTGSGTLNVSHTKKLPGNMVEATYRHEVVSAHDSEGDADEALAEYEADFKKNSIPVEYGSRHLKKDVLYEGTGLRSASLDLLKRSVKDALPGAAGDAAVEQITRFYIERLPDTSAKKSQLRARKVQGASRSMLHVYASFMQGVSYHQAQMEYGHQIASNLTTKTDEAVKALRAARASGQADMRVLDQADDITAIIDTIKGNDAKNNTLQAAQQKGGESLVMALWQRVPQLAGAWLLTGPGTIITNGFQPAVITLPHLGARHGFPQATAALSGAYKDVLRPATVGVGKELWRSYKNIPASIANLKRGGQGITSKDVARPFYRQATANLNQLEKDMIEQLVNDKKLDYGVAADLQTLKSRQGIGWNAVTYMSNAAFIMPQAVETLNRTVTAVASYRLNKASNPNLTESELWEIAARDIDQTQFNYTQSNKPGYAQNEMLRAALVFKTYAQAMTYTIGHNLTMSFDKTNPVERRIARRFIGGLFASTVITSGLMGVVAFEPIYWSCVALMALFGDDDDDLDPEQAMRQALSGWNEDVVSMLAKGGFHATGLADTSRMALPQFFNAPDMVRNFQGQGDGWLAMLGATLVGAPGSVTEQVGKAAGDLASGDIAKGLAGITPKAFGINDLARMYAYAHEGVKTSAGYTAVEAGDVSLADKVTRALGFDPPGISDAKGRARSYYRRDERLRGTQQDLLKRFGTATLSRDSEARDKALDAIRAFNKKYPASRITKDSLTSSLKGRYRSQVNVSRFGVNAATPGQRALVADVAEGYGGAE